MDDPSGSPVPCVNAPVAGNAPTRNAARRSSWLAGALLVAAVVAAYLPALRCGFIWDDDQYLPQGSGSFLTTNDGLRRIWTTTATPQYYPLVFTTYWLEHQLWGFNPIGYHLVNVLLHAANAFLVWRILLYLKLPGAWLAAAIFGLHPVHVESVAWVTERKNTLSGLFYLLSLAAYLRFSDGRGWRWYAASLPAYLAALLSKTVTCSLPVAMGLLFVLRRPRIPRAAILGLVPFLAIGAFMGRLTSWYEFHLVEPRYWAPIPVSRAVALSWTEGPERHRSGYTLTPPMRAILASRALLFYAGKLAWPPPQSFFYHRWDEARELNPTLARNYRPVIAVAAIALVVVACGLFKSTRGVFVAFGFFVATVFPALGFVDVWPMRFSFVADHFQYLASLGLIVLASAGVARLLARAGWLAAGLPLAGMLAAMGAATWMRIPVFAGEETLWVDTIAKTPDSWYAMNNLGALRFEQRRDSEAETLLQAAIAGNPRLHEAHVNLARLRLNQGRRAEAESLLRTSLDLAPNYMPGHQLLAQSLIERGQLAEALEVYDRAVERLPQENSIRWERARLLQRMPPGSRPAASTQPSG